MTLYLLDVASYQGSLATADVVRAGFDVVNVKVSHGLTLRAVHPDVAGWVTRARAAGLGVCSFHFLTGDAAGAAQADYSFARLEALGLLSGAGHVVDVETNPAGPDATLTILRDYLTVMQPLLRRPVMVYSAQHWWRPRGWQVADLTPHVHAAPDKGNGSYYPGSYPGDSSPAWSTTGWGGWKSLSVMQYAVAPMSFPDGTRGTIDVSKSAIRDPAVWVDLTTRRADMTNAPQSILNGRAVIRRETGLAWVSLGVIGDDNHNKSGSSYHLGKSALRSDSYTITESSRDRNGLSEDASALDIGWFSISRGGKTHTLRTFSLWLVEQCKAGTADTSDIREVIYSPDGKTVRRWDRLGKRSTGDDSHLTHTHISWFRDSTKRDNKAALFERYFTTIKGQAAPAPKPPVPPKPPATPVEDTMELNDRIDSPAYAARTVKQLYNDLAGMRGYLIGDPHDTQHSGVSVGSPIARLVAVPEQVSALSNAVAALAVSVGSIAQNLADDADVADLRRAVADAQAATVAGVLDGLSDEGRTDAEVATMLRSLLGDRASAVGALLQRAG